MNAIGITFLALDSLALLALPRRWAPIALLVGACYVPLNQGIEIGPFSFTVLRLLLATGFIRAGVRREWRVGSSIRMDWLMLGWGGWALVSSALHQEPMATLIGALGMVYNALGMYFLMRTFCRDLDEAQHVIVMTALVLVP